MTCLQLEFIYKLLYAGLGLGEALFQGVVDGFAFISLLSTTNNLNSGAAMGCMPGSNILWHCFTCLSAADFLSLF